MNPLITILTLALLAASAGAQTLPILPACNEQRSNAPCWTSGEQNTIVLPAGSLATQTPYIPSEVRNMSNDNTCTPAELIAAIKAAAYWVPKAITALDNPYHGAIHWGDYRSLKPVGTIAPDWSTATPEELRVEADRREKEAATARERDKRKNEAMALFWEIHSKCVEGKR